MCDWLIIILLMEANKTVLVRPHFICHSRSGSSQLTPDPGETVMWKYTTSKRQLAFTIMANGSPMSTYWMCLTIDSPAGWTIALTTNIDHTWQEKKYQSLSALTDGRSCLIVRLKLA